MGLRRWISTLALREVHVLIAERPGWALTRIAAERFIGARGWRVASSPADADALLCCGGTDPEFDPLTRRLAAQLPGPQAVGRAGHPDEVAKALDQILGTLRAEYPAPASFVHHPVRNEEASGSATEMDHGDMDHGDMDHGDMDQADMSGPGGIALAGGHQDRDGLEMDVLPVRLGPVLPGWPAGLVLSVTLAGDLVGQCHPELIGLRAENVLPQQVSRVQQAALAADRIGGLLMLAGAGRAEHQLRQLRDGLLDGAEIPWCAEQLRALVGGLFRSRSLRWSLRDLGRIEPSTLQEMDQPLGWSGDVLDRLHRRLSGLSAMVAELAGSTVRGDLVTGPSIDRAGLDLVADTMRGLDLGTARLVVASFDIDLAGGVAAGPSAVIAGHGEPS